MKHIQKNLKGLGKPLWLGPLFKLLEAILELTLPLITASIIDVGVAQRDGAYVFSRGVLMVFVAAVGVVFAMICQYYAAVAGSKLGESLRSSVFVHMQRLSMGQIDGIGRSGLSTRITNDVNQIQAALNMFIRLGTRMPFLTLGAIIMAMWIDFYIGLVYLVATAFICVVLVLVVRKTLSKYGQIQKGQDELFRLAHENLEGVRVIRAFSRQEEERKAFQTSANFLNRLLVHTGRISALMNPAASVVANLAIIIIVWIGAGAVNTGTMMTGDIIALVNYMTQILLALLMATNLLVLFTRALASTERVEALLELQPNIIDGQGATPKQDGVAISFDHVNFRYFEAATNALSDVSLTVKFGQSVGVIGGTGSGKSTLSYLMMRHFDVQSGTVSVCGENVCQYTLQQLRSQFGVVMQGSRLLSGSIRSNLLLSSPQADEARMWQALQTAQAADFVKEKPDGLDSIVTEGGGGLSGGQRQRLLIARALVRQPDILVLDDAASALDYATEAALRASLKKWKTQKGTELTVLNISQRVASIQGCDVIYVLDEGRVVANGSHANLLQHCELYREICASQGVSR